MGKITPFLWFDDNAEEAMEFYCSIFPDAKVENVSRQGDRAFLVSFELAGQKFFGLNGGPQDFGFDESVSFHMECDDQDEVDRLWSALLEGGGTESRCGWLADRYGLWWQIIPEALPRLLGDPDPGRAQRAMEAMLKMVKIDVAGLEAAADGPEE